MTDLVISWVRRSGSNGLAIYFEKSVNEKKGFPFRLGDKVLVRIGKHGVTVKKIDEKLLERLM